MRSGVKAGSKPRRKARPVLARPSPLERLLADVDAPAAAPAAGAAPGAGKEEAEAPATPRLGTHGQKYSQGVFDEDWNPELTEWDSRVARLDELRRGDSVVAGALAKLLASILSTKHVIEDGETVAEMPSVKAAKAAEGLDPDAPDPAADEDLAGKDRAALARIVLQNNLLRTGGAPEYRMRTKFADYLGEQFTAQSFGVCFHEVTWRVQAGRLGTFNVVDALWWIHPRSITKLFLDRNGELLGVLQEADAAFFEGTPTPESNESKEKLKRVILAEDLLIHTCDREGANVLGNPRIRPMWLDAKRRNFLAQAQVVDAQKRAVGIPYVKLGSNSHGDAKEFAITQARRMREGGQELAYVVMMGDEEVGYLDMGANVPDLTPIIRAQEARIRGVVAQEQFGLGQEGTGGSRAVAGVNADYYDMLLSLISESQRSSTQFGLCEKWSRLNFPDIASPELRASKDTARDLGQYNDLALAQVLIVTGDVVNTVHDALKLPRLSPELTEKYNAEPVNAQAKGAFGQPAEQLDEDGNPIEDDEKDAGKGKKPPAGKAPPGKRAPGKGASAKKPAPPAPEKKLADVTVPGIARPLWREPTHHEREFLRLADIDRAFEDFLRDWVQEIGTLRNAAVREALRKLRVTGKRAYVPRLREAPFRDAMEDLTAGLREVARESARQEIRKQVELRRRVELASKEDEPPAFDPFEPADDPAAARGVTPAAEVAQELQDELEVKIQFDVERILHDITASIENQMLSALEEGMTEEQARDAVRRAVLGKTDFDLRKTAREQASKTFNDGRAEVVAQVRETFERHPEAGVRLDVVTRSEILDDATCDTCEGLDGHEVAIDSDDYWEYMPPNKCQGGPLCRGFYILVVQEAAA